MNSTDDYQAKIEIIKAIPGDRIRTPNSIPVEIYIQEAKNLYTWCQPDKDQLVSKGLAWDLVTDIPARCGALREAESIWCKDRFSREEATKRWLTESPLAYELRNRLVQEFRFAFRNDNKLLSKVSSIADGNGHADMIQDLNDLSVLGKANTDLLAKINFDVSLLDQAAQMSYDMSNLLAEATEEKADDSVSKQIRDQAYTYLWEAVDEISDYGQFVFRLNNKRLRGYRSDFLRRERSRRITPTPSPTPSLTPAPTPPPSPTPTQAAVSAAV